MKISIVINVLRSYEVVRRQIEHFRKMNLPDDIEIIFVDDGSNPPIQLPEQELKNLAIYYTNDKRPWTQGLARNLGAKMAKGEYLMMTDVDHIWPKESIDSVYNFTGDKMVFPRYYGILDEEGVLHEDLETLFAYGLDPNRLKGRRRGSAGFHGNSFAIKKSIFDEIGGYEVRRCIGMKHQGKGRGEDIFFALAYSCRVAQSICKPQEEGPKMFIFPIGKFHITGDTNPMGLFHGLQHEPVVQPMLP